MRLLLQELKKIWNPGILAALVLLGGMYYYMFPSFYIEYFCNGDNARAEFDLAAGWLEKYGPTMEPSERAELDGQREEEIAVFNGLIARISEAAVAGLTDYDRFMAYRERYYAGLPDAKASEDSERLLWRVIGGTNYYWIETLNQFMERYDALTRRPVSRDERFAALYSPEEQARILALEKQKRGYLPSPVQDSTSEYGKDLAVWIVLSIVLLLSPTLVRDRLHRTRATQWASRTGRRVLTVQFAAGLLSALGLTLLNLVLYGIPFLAQHPLLFRDCPLFNAHRGGFTWFDWTYGQYLLVLAALLLALGISAGGLTLFLSQYSGNYVAMLLKAVPLFIAVGALFGNWLLDRPFYFKHLFESAESRVPRGAEAVCALALMILSLLLLLWTIDRQKRRELSA